MMNNGVFRNMFSFFLLSI